MIDEFVVTGHVNVNHAPLVKCANDQVLAHAAEAGEDPFNDVGGCPLFCGLIFLVRRFGAVSHGIQIILFDNVNQQ